MAYKRFFISKLFFAPVFSLLVLTVNGQVKKVKANGIVIAYETFGNTRNPKIILINGTGAQMTDWPLAFCKKLARQGYEVIRFDNRDVGLSTKLHSLGQPNWAAILPLVKTCKPAPTPYALMDMANDVIGLMDALKIKKANIAGASMGGAIAQLVTIHYPQRVLSLTSISASTGDPNLPVADSAAIKAMSTPAPPTKNKDSLANYVAGVYKALGSTDNDLDRHKKALEQITRSWYPEGTSRQVAAVLIGDNCDRREQLAKITVPVNIIHGDVDPLVKVAAAQQMAGTIPHSKLNIIKGMGHDFSLGFVDTMTDLIAKNAVK